MEILFERDLLAKGINREDTEIEPKNRYARPCVSGEVTFFLRDLAQQNDRTPGTWYLRVNHVTMESREWRQIRDTGPLTFVSSPEITGIEFATMCYFGGGNTMSEEGKKRFGRIIERPRLVKLGTNAAEVPIRLRLHLTVVHDGAKRVRLQWQKKTYGKDDGFVQIGITLLKVAPNGSYHPEGLPTYTEAHLMEQ